MQHNGNEGSKIMILSLAIINQFKSVCGEIDVYPVPVGDIMEIYGDALEKDKFHNTTLRYLSWVNNNKGSKMAEKESLRLWDTFYASDCDHNLVWYLKGDGEL